MSITPKTESDWRLRALPFSISETVVIVVEIVVVVAVVISLFLPSERCVDFQRVSSRLEIDTNTIATKDRRQNADAEYNGETHTKQYK